MRAKFKITKENIKVQFSINRPQIPAVFKINAAGADWGSIRGNIENQIDLQNALNQKADLNYVENEFTTIDYRLESLEDNIPILEGEINKKPDRDELSTIAFSGDYNDLSIKPIIGNGTLTLLQNGDFVGDFKANATNNKTWNIDIPTKLSQLENDIADIDVEQVNNAIERHNQSEDAHRYIQGRIVRLDDKYTVVTEMLNSEIANANDRITANANNITIVNNNLTALGQLVNENYDTLNENILKTEEKLSNDLLATSNSLNLAIEQEAMTRESADNNLQSQIDSITAASDVVAIVGTYAELLQYDTATLTPDDIIKVLNDEIHENASSYYRWTGSAWVYIGSEGPFYTKSEANSTFVPQTRTINNKALTNNINLTASDVKALPDTTVIGNGNLTVQKNGVNIANFSANETTNVIANISVPTSVSELTNDANYVTSNQLETGLNAKQDKLIAGTGIEITAENVINSTAVTEWGEIQGELSNQEDLQTALDSKVGISNAETITGAKTFTQPIKIQNGQGTGSLWIGGNVNSGNLTNKQRHLARISVPSYDDVTLATTMLGFDSSGDSALHITNKGQDALSFGGQTKITNATSPMAIGFCVAKTRNATAASDKIYPLELDSTEARFNVQPNFNGDDLVTKTELETKQNKLTAGNNIVIENDVISAEVEVQGGEKYGIKGDYSTHYGIEYCQYGLIEYTLENTITVKGGMILCVPGADTKTTIASDINYDVMTTTDFTLFYADGSLLEVLDVFYSIEEPVNITDGFIAWFNPEVGVWQFKSNDTGNVWREASATPLADIKFLNGNIVRVDYIGYRILNDDIYALKSDVPDVSEIYTKSETDTLLDKKQGLLTPVLPITVQEKVKSNTVGMSYTSGYTGVYSTTGSSYNIQNVSPMYARGTTTFNSTWDENSIKSYIDVPYQIGDIVTTGAFGTFYTGSIVFGKVLPNGTFIPIVSPTGITVSINDIVTITDSTTATMDTVTTTYTRADASTSKIQNVPYKDKQQIVQIQRSGSGYTFSVIKTNGTGTFINSYVYTVSDNINRIAEINTARITPAGTSSDGVGVISASAYSVDSIGSYSFDGALGVDTCDFSTLVNKFDLSDVQVNTYLEVKYDNQTIQVNSDGELVANLDSYALKSEIPDISNLATKTELEAKQDKLTAGENITIENNVISAVVPENTGGGMPIGTIYSLNCTDNYVPEGSLPCDGAEYSKTQFNDLWENYLTGEEETYYAYGNVYVKSEIPQIGDVVYKYQNGFVETDKTVVGVEDGAIIIQKQGTAPSGTPYPPERTNRTVNNDIVITISLLNTCTYSEYEADLATYGQCEKFAIDEVNGTFRVPLKNKVIIDIADTVDVAGNGMTLGLTNGTNNYGLDSDNGGYGAGYVAGSYGSPVGSSVGSWANLKGASVGVTTDSTKSGIIADTTNAKTYTTLRYFVVVANGSINQSMMDWSAWASSLQGKADKTGVDGQFIPKQLHVMTGADAISGTEYDLSTYLPDDSHTYLVKFLLKGYDDDGEYFYYINTDVWNYNKTSTASTADCYLYGGVHSRQNVVSIDLPVGAGRCMQVVGSGADALNIFCIGYRRLGTNS